MSDAPALTWFCDLRVEVGAVLSAGPTPVGERRCVPLQGGSVHGPGLQGEVVPGGADWQTLRGDGVLEISAHYLLRLADGALVEVRSNGLRHGPPEVMAALAAGADVPASAYFFRTLVTLHTGAPGWLHLNRLMLVARAERQAQRVLLRLFSIG